VPQNPSKARKMAKQRSQTAALGATVDIDFWRNTLRGRQAKLLAAVATYDGRGHRRGEPVPLYGANPRLAADDEFLHAHPLYSGLKIRSTRLTGRLLMVDGTQDAVADVLETTVEQLSDPNDQSVCQRVAAELFGQGVHVLQILSSRARSRGSVLIVERSAALELLREDEIVYRTITQAHQPRD
jgi:hypothetical protein